VVDALLAHQAGAAAPRRLLAGRRDVPTGEVRGADVHDLALLHERVEGLPGLVPGAVAVDVVHLVEVDVVGLEALQAGLAVLADLVGGEVATVAVGLRVRVRPLHRVVDLGGQHDRVAPAVAEREPVADDALGLAAHDRPAVDVGGVEEVDAELERAVHDRERVVLAGVPAEVHGPEAEVADEDAVLAEPCVVDAHGGLLPSPYEVVGSLPQDTPARGRGAFRARRGSSQSTRKACQAASAWTSVRPMWRSNAGQHALGVDGSVGLVEERSERRDARRSVWPAPRRCVTNEPAAG
jgi:hypothetical protein